MPVRKTPALLVRVFARTSFVAGLSLLLLTSCGEREMNSVTVPLTFDHNRILVDAEIERSDCS